MVCVSSQGDVYSFEFDTRLDEQGRKDLFFAFADKSMPITEQKEIEASLEDIFLELTKTPAKEENENESDI